MLERRGMLGHDRGPVPGVVPRRAVPPAQPPHRGQRQRLTADPGQAQPSGHEHRRGDVQQRGGISRGRDDQGQQGAEDRERARGAEPEQPDAAPAAPPAVVPRALAGRA